MKKITYLGIGTMGGGMVSNLLKGGYDVTIWNRTIEKCQAFVKQGAKQASTTKEAILGADVIIYCLSNDSAVDDLVFGQGDVLNLVTEGQIIIDMSTVNPQLSLREYDAFAEKKVEFIDAPVFGSKGEAANGGLWIVAGGKKEVFEEVKSILAKLSETIHYMGESGKGTSMKLVGNLIVGFQMEALGEAMILACKAGLNPEDVLKVLHVTDFKSPIFDGVGSALLNRDFSPNFALKLMLKDANLISDFAQELNSPIPAFVQIRETIKSAVNMGYSKENASALIKALEVQAGSIVCKK